MDPLNAPAKFKIRIALLAPVIIAIEVLGGGCEPPVLGKRRL